MTDINKLKELERLERTIVKGLEAYEQRNVLICDLLADGHRQIDVTRAINAVRTKMNAPVITPDAVAATLKRVQRKTTKQVTT